LPVEDPFAKNQNLSRGELMSSCGLKVNGKIFAMLGQGKVVAKLPKERVDELVAGGEGEPFDPGHGRLMREWVTVELGRENWVELAEEAYEFVKRANLRSARKRS